MTLASRLHHIAKATGKAQAKMAAEFSYDIAGHRHERFLRECLIQAQLGQTKVRRAQSTIDESLQREGFEIVRRGTRTYISFEENNTAE